MFSASKWQTLAERTLIIILVDAVEIARRFSPTLRGAMLSVLCNPARLKGKVWGEEEKKIGFSPTLNM